MKARISILALLLIVIVGCTQETFPPEFEQKPLKRILASKNEYYGPAARALKTLLVTVNC